MNFPIPLLGFSDFLPWVYSGRKKQRFLDGYDRCEWFSSGSVALAKICEAISKQKGRSVNVLLPAYYCGQSLRYLRTLPVNLSFYELDENLDINYVKLRKLHLKNSIDLLIHVHYFGCIKPQNESRQFADELGALLVEDCAHIISPGSHDDWLGDILVFSPHKHFPLPQISLTLLSCDLKISKSLSRQGLPLLWVLKAVVKRLRKRSQMTSWGSTWCGDTQQLTLKYPSKIMINIASGYLENWGLAGKKRKKNSEALLEKLTEIKGWVPWCNEAQVPYVVGMLCDTEEKARMRYQILNKRYKIVMQWPDMPIELKKQLELSNLVENWHRRALFFFVHQKIDIEDTIYEVSNRLKQEENSL